MNKNLGRRIHPIAEADGLSPKKLVKASMIFNFFYINAMETINLNKQFLETSRIAVSSKQYKGLLPHQ